MAKGRDKNYVSIWFWLLTMLVMVIPLVNIVMALIWAFTGANETRKNYFKAMIVAFCVLTGFWIFMAMVLHVPLFFTDQWHKLSTPSATPAQLRNQ